MITFEKASEIIKKAKSNSYMETGFELSDKYIFAMVPNSIKNPDNCTDPFFSVDKKTGKVSEWNITFDLEAYREAMKKPLLYKRESK